MSLDSESKGDADGDEDEDGGVELDRSGADPKDEDDEDQSTDGTKSESENSSESEHETEHETDTIGPRPHSLTKPPPQTTNTASSLPKPTPMPQPQIPGTTESRLLASLHRFGRVCAAAGVLPGNIDVVATATVRAVVAGAGGSDDEYGSSSSHGDLIGRIRQAAQNGLGGSMNGCATKTQRTSPDTSTSIGPGLDPSSGSPAVLSNGGGPRVRVLGGSDEGILGALGVAASLPPPVRGLVVDLGGGSCQLTWVEGDVGVGVGAGVGEPGTVADGGLRIGSGGSVSLPYGAAALIRRLSEARTQARFRAWEWVQTQARTGKDKGKERGSEAYVQAEAGVAEAKAEAELEAEVCRGLEEAYERLGLPGLVAASDAPVSYRGQAGQTSMDGCDDDSKRPGLYLAGGGLRSWGYLLMHMHMYHKHKYHACGSPYPYPIPLINGFSVSREAFADITAVCSQLGGNVSPPSSLFRISARRTTQIPAIALVVRALAATLPPAVGQGNGRIMFSQGGVREGVVVDRYAGSRPPDSGDSRGYASFGCCGFLQEHPLVAATRAFAQPGNASNSSRRVAALLRAAIPQESTIHDLNRNSIDENIPNISENQDEDKQHQQQIPPIITAPPFLTALANLSTAPALTGPIPKDIRAAAALRVPITGPLTGTVAGIGHGERAALALALFTRWGGECDVGAGDHDGDAGGAGKKEKKKWKKLEKGKEKGKGKESNGGTNPEAGAAQQMPATPATEMTTKTCPTRPVRPDEPDIALARALASLLTPAQVWWARYVGAVAALGAEVWPAVGVEGEKEETGEGKDVTRESAVWAETRWVVGVKGKEKKKGKEEEGKEGKGKKEKKGDKGKKKDKKDKKDKKEKKDKKDKKEKQSQEHDNENQAPALQLTIHASPALIADDPFCDDSGDEDGAVEGWLAERARKIAKGGKKKNWVVDEETGEWVGIKVDVRLVRDSGIV